MNFSRALDGMKQGRKFGRAAWNTGLNQFNDFTFVVGQKGYPDGIPINTNTAEATQIPEGTVCTFNPYLMMHQRGVFEPYTPTQADLHAEDWQWIDNANMEAVPPLPDGNQAYTVPTGRARMGVSTRRTSDENFVVLGRPLDDDNFIDPRPIRDDPQG